MQTQADLRRRRFRWLSAMVITGEAVGLGLAQSPLPFGLTVLVITGLAFWALSTWAARRAAKRPPPDPQIKSAPISPWGLAAMASGGVFFGTAAAFIRSVVASGHTSFRAIVAGQCALALMFCLDGIETFRLPPSDPDREYRRDAAIASLAFGGVIALLFVGEVFLR